MQVSSDISEHGVRERRFDLTVDGRTVPGLLWTPPDGDGPRPLVLFGHGGTQHKRSENILAMARRVVRNRGYAALALDAPNHGERRSAEDIERQRLLLREFNGRLPPFSPEQMRKVRATVPQSVQEWRAALDAVQALPEVGLGPIGYWGLSMGCSIGIPLLAAESRIHAAILGLGALRPGDEALEHHAALVTVPLLFIFQLDDELMTPEQGIALFRALGSRHKTMHINPGRHIEIPAHEREGFELFWARHLEVKVP
jgi:dienelactone hydrolase